MDGIVLVAHGTISQLSELPDFLRRIRRGREPSAELLHEMELRYRAIGGSPLLQLTQAQASALGQATGLEVWVAMRLWEPSVEQVLEQVAERGIRRVCVIPLAPFSVDVYLAAARSAQTRCSPAAQQIELLGVPPWGLHPRFVAAHVALILRSVAEQGWRLQDCQVVLSAHSLPLAVVRAGDNYANEVSACAQAIGQQLGCPVTLAYQSEGADGGQWLGPSLRSTLEACASNVENPARQVVLAPFGFLADHVETLYDLDREASVWAQQLGLKWLRVPALNTDAGLIGTLAELARSSLS